MSVSERHKSPAASPLHHGDLQKESWSRLHIDFAVPIKDKMLLIIMDAQSKWIDVDIPNSSTETVTLHFLITMDYLERLYQTMDRISRLVNLNNL